MGMCSCCKTESSMSDYDNVINLTVMPLFPTVQITFSSENADKLDLADCVVVNATRNHPKTQFYLSHLNEKDLQQIKALITKDQPGEVEVINNPVTSLKVTDLIVIHLPVWGLQGAEDNVVKALNSAFEEAVERNHKSLIITQFEASLGIPLNVSIRILYNLISRFQQKITKITFSIKNKQAREYFLKEMSGGGKVDRTTSGVSSSLSR